MPKDGEFRYEEGLTEDEKKKLLKDGFHEVPPNPYDTRQMVAYLKLRPAEARSLIWTLNLELTPVYSVDPIGPFGDRVYHVLVEMLDGQSQAEGSPNYVERVSVPAVLSGKSIRLFSGQEVSQLLVDAPRGMYAWKTNALIAQARPIMEPAKPDPQDETPEDLLRQVLNKLYYEYRNLGIASPDRALNFAATNIFTLAGVLAAAWKLKKTLDRIDVVKSPYGRIDSDCWDVQLKFQDPDNTNRAYTVFRYTLDVSDKLPVTMGKVVSYISTT
jgi:cyanobactin maturation PatA/PatG family protease